MTRVSIRIARHPAVVPVGLCYGRTEVPIQGTPERTAAVLADTFDAPPPSLVWSSPSLRCAEVARALALRWGADVRIDPRLHEVDFGAWEGRPWQAIEREDRAAYESWMINWKSSSPPGGESLAALEQRVRSWLNDPRPIATEAVVGHAGFVRALRVLVEGVSWEAALGREVPHLGWQRFTVATPLAAPTREG